MALRLQAPRLDRIVRGRAWIPVLGAMLVAIVGLRVEVLKLGASVGTEVQQATTLQSSNAALRAQISALSDNQRIAKLAAGYGMHMPNPLDVHFVPSSAGGHVGAAIRNISPASRDTFLTGLAGEQQTDQLSTQAGSTLSAVGTPTTSIASSGTTAPAAGTTSSSATTGAASTPTSGYSAGGALSTAGTTSSTAGTGATAPTTATPASTPGATSTATSTASGGAATGAGGIGATNGATDPTGGGGQTLASTNGGAGLAG